MAVNGTELLLNYSAAEGRKDEGGEMAYEDGEAKKRPSVAFADYDIGDKRSSLISSLLLLSAIVEGVASFVLPIIDAFGPPKYVEHKFYFEIFQIFQFTLSIAALAYLQALMVYYDRKMRRRERLCKELAHGESVYSNEHVREEEEEEEEEEDEENGWNGSGESVPTTPADGVSPTSPTEGSSGETFQDASPTSPSESDAPPSEFCLIHEQSREAEKEAEEVKEKEKEESHSTRSSKSAPTQRNRPMGPSKTVVIHTSESVEEKERKLGAVEMRSPSFRRRVTHLGRMFGDTLGINKRNPPYTRDSEGINLYLRLGTVVFGFGVMITDGFRVADQFRAVNSERNCHSVLWIPLNVIHSIYIFWQTYFLFKYHRVIFNVQKFFIRFILSHMAVSNLGQWLSTVVEEVVYSEAEMEYSTNAAHSLAAAVVGERGLVPEAAEQPARLPSGLNHTENVVHCRSQAAAFVHYLIPCGVEYSLIAGAIFYKMFQRIGHVQHRCASTVGANRRMAEGADRHVTIQSYTRVDDPTECHRAHKGLFVGLLLFLATLVTLALFYIFLRRHNYTNALTIYQINYIILFSVGIIAVSFALVRIKALHFRDLSEEDAFDDNLLLVGLLAVLFYDMFILVPAVSAKEHHHQLEGAMFVGKSILEIIQALLQVFLILEASRREAGTTEHTIQKPGRTMITFLLVLNLAMWIINTFGLKHAENHDIFRLYYSGLGWEIITHLSLPLIIFFRFHSTVCLADIWTHAYRMHKRTDV